MKDSLLRFLIPIILWLKKHKYNWETTKTRVLVYESDVHRIRSFEKLIDSAKKTKQGYEFILTKSKFAYLHLISEADIIFSYGIHRWMNLERLTLLYIGITGYTFPEKYLSFQNIITAPNFSSEYIADFILGSVISFERRLYSAQYHQKMKSWRQNYYTDPQPKNISDLKIGIIGLGSIGQKVSKTFHQLSAEVHAFDPVVSSYSKFVDFSYNKNNWNTIQTLVDYLILAVPYNNSTHHLINKDMFNEMNPNICLINVTRGEVIDEEALITALRSKRIRGAILDVFKKEPLPFRNRLWSLDNVFITPHVSGNVSMVCDKIQADFLNRLS